MNLARFSRRRYADGPTPLQPLTRLSQVLGGPNLFIKRDDQLGFAAGGNKVRKLEFVMADALEQGADFIITCGAVQSNHCRLTLAAAVREGLKCGLVLEERVPGSYKPQASGNNFLYRLMGVDRVQVVPGGSDMMGAMNIMADQVRAQGGHPYLIPGGASNPLGALGYAACAQEILSQAFDMGLRIDRVVCASGSAGTHAGLLTGFWGARSGIAVVGMNVSRTKAQQEELVFKLAGETAALASIDAALFIASARAFLLAEVQSFKTPARLARDVNRYLTRDSATTGRFMSMFFLEIDPRAKTLRWVRAGHEPAMVYDSVRATFRELSGEGMAMGVLDTAEYRDYTQQGWEPASVIVIGTDGITETRNTADALFGAERVRQVVRANASRSAAGIQSAVIEAVQDFRGQASQEDDVTLVVVKLL